MNLELMKDCHACSLRLNNVVCGAILTSCGSILTRHRYTLPTQHQIAIVCDRPNNEAELFEEPVAGREGDALFKLLHEANIRYPFITYAVKCNGEPKANHIKSCTPWLEEEIRYIKPELILAMGKLATSVLLGLPRSIFFDDYVGKIVTSKTLPVKVAVWHSPSILLNCGKKISSATATFFSQLKEHYVQSAWTSEEIVSLGIKRSPATN